MAKCRTTYCQEQTKGAFRYCTPKCRSVFRKLTRKRLENAPPKKFKNDGFYRSRKWLALRYEFLKISNAICDCCGATNQELHVDHIKPRSKYPALALDIGNLQVLCRACNKGKGNRDETDWRE